LWKIELSRGKQKKTIYATAEHRWMMLYKRKKGDAYSPTGGAYTNDITQERTTEQLQVGDRLRSARAHPPGSTGMVPFAIAQGFVFGDGVKGDGDRPCRLPIYNLEKDEAMLPFFAAHSIRPITFRGKKALSIYGLPRLWKSLPDFRESRPFLLSWLAGYFAADGTVSEDGMIVRLDSASKEAILCARDIAAICGVGYGQVRTTWRRGYQQEDTALYNITLDVYTLPEWFFLIKRHRERIQRRLLSTVRDPERYWIVGAAVPTDRVEEVYCAVVPDVQVFGLADGIMTGNCIMSTLQDLQRAAQCPDNAGIYRALVALEAESAFSFQQDQWLGDIAPHLLTDQDREGLAEAKRRAQRRAIAEARLPAALLYDKKGWPTRMITSAEAVLLAEVRAVVAETAGLALLVRTPEEIRDRYAFLLERKARKDAQATTSTKKEEPAIENEMVAQRELFACAG
jgi:hypothetical protein